MLNITFRKYLQKGQFRHLPPQVYRTFWLADDLTVRTVKEVTWLTTWRRRIRSRGLDTCQRIRPEQLLCNHHRVREKKKRISTELANTSWPSQNGGDGPHPAESLPSAGEEAVARIGRRISFFPAKRPARALELSRSRAGRSCLPQMTFPPSPTAPIGFNEMKLTFWWFSRGDLRRLEMVVAVVARDSTRDSIVSPLWLLLREKQMWFS